MSLRSRRDPRTADVDAAAEAVRQAADPLSGAALDRLAESVGDATFVLLGEASHGTSEFYRLRAQLTARLVRDYDVSFVAVEGDWTDCHEVNRFVRGDHEAADAGEVLSAFDRWPIWMWDNWEVSEFVSWLREWNDGRASDEQVGFYGVDVYSLFESMDAVLDYLEERDPDAAARARDAYHCFSPYGEDAREYARSTRLVPENCEDEVVDALVDLRRNAPTPERADGEAYFAAEQNALVVKNAEEYYRTMTRGNDESWNVRDTHMADTVERVADHLGPDATGVVWAHNTHVGDARATDMVDRGRLNVGQLLRERHGDKTAVVGFGTHRGEVIAADSWGADRERLPVPEARAGSYGDAFRRAGVGNAVTYAADVDADGALAGPRGQRAIGVVYDPDREWGNYVPTSLAERYDAFVHVDETTALHPTADERGGGPPEAYPWGV